MKILENLMLAFSSLRANKMRALLTMLGIIIGIGSVIAIMTLGDSLTSSVTNSMSGLGANNITLSLKSKKEESSGFFGMFGGGGSSIDEKHLFTDEMLDELKASFSDELDSISVSTSVGSGKTTNGKLYANLSLTGVNDDYFDANSVTIIEGRLLNDKDVDGAKKVAVVSDMLVNNMFDGENAIGKQISITVDDHVGIYTVVGIYEYQSDGSQTAADKDVSTDVYIPVSTAQKITRNYGYQSATLLIKSNVDSEQFMEDVTAFFNRYYSRNEDYGISLSSMESMMETMTEMLDTIELAIAAIAAISLLVGGIGVMNIMMVSITERTREIGIRKAIGATNGEIRTQFVFEAVVICLIGGLIGTAFGVALGTVGASLLGTPAEASLSTIALAVGFSMAIGVFFGYYPANKAAKLDPIDALRYE